MSLPATLGILQAAAGVMSAIGAYQAGQAQASQYEAQAARAERRAHEEVLAAGQEETRLKRKMGIIKGEQRAGYGASGFSPGTGTPLASVLDTELEGTKDVATLRYNAQVRRADLQDEANYARSAADSARSAGKLSAITSLLGTGATVATSWYKMGYTPFQGGTSTGWNVTSSAAAGSPLTYNNSGYRHLFHRGR